MDGDRLRLPANRNCYAFARLVSFAQISCLIVLKQSAQSSRKCHSQNRLNFDSACLRFCGEL